MGKQDIVAIHDITPRPVLGRQDTEHLLSYYHSPDADTGFHPAAPAPLKSAQNAPRRQLSVASSSSSEYSSESSASEYSSKDQESSPQQQRSRKASEGAGDRRRLAVVEMDTVPEATPGSSSSNIRSRRGVEDSLDGLALVVPPDAVERLISFSTPVTAPASALPIQYQTLDAQEDKRHKRAASDAPGRSTRNVAIVGSSTPPLLAPLVVQTTVPHDSSLRPPIFLHPQARSTPSPIYSAASEITLDGIPTLKRHLTDQSILTPEIGDHKEINDPVAAPVTMPLAPPTHDHDHSRRSNKQAPFLHYQPGVDATAGPLPPPPMASFSFDRHSPPPPRPPRLHSPSPTPSSQRDLDSVRRALELPSSVTAALSKTKPKAMKSVESASVSMSSSISLDEVLHGAHHTREAAFSPSMASSTSSPVIAETSPSLTQSMEQQSKPSLDVHSITVESPVQSRPSIDGWVSVNRELTSSPEPRASSDLSATSSRSSMAPSPPPKSPKNLRNSLTKSLRRMSLSRSPSNKSLSRSSSRVSGSLPRAPSPPEMPIPPPLPRQLVPRRKVKTLYPAAMYCHEVQSQRSIQERCQIYAQKINELYICDCGLEEWLAVTLQRGSNSGRSAAKENANPPSLPSVMEFSPQPRQVSGGSLFSEITFPARPDGTYATDLASRAGSTSSHGTAPVLPYPAIAGRQQVPPPSAMRMVTNLQSSPSKAGSFFSSLSKKASMRKPQSQSTLLSGTHTSTRLTKNPPASVLSRPQVTVNPSIPGGPRGPSNRMLRSQSIMPSSPFSSTSNKSDRRSALHRRPSLNASPNTHSSDLLNASPTAAEFAAQVDKLADLLPQADRSVLALYLKRSGQDILAIGQYLEDEKNGTLLRP